MQLVAIQGIPFDANSSFLRGASAGPTAILESFHSSSANYCTQNGVDLMACKDFWVESGDIKFSNDEPKAAYDLIYKNTSHLLAEGFQTISLGGDHSITYPIIAAYAEHYPQLNILQIDAHGDLYHDFEGNFYSHASPFARIMENNLAVSLTQIGNRTLTPHQRQQADKFGVSIIEMKDFDLNKLPKLKGPLYLSFDLDALDPAFAPGVAHHEPGGLSTREALKIIEAIEVPIVGADIAELNPNRDINGMTAMVAGKLLKEVLAKMII